MATVNLDVQLIRAGTGKEAVGYLTKLRKNNADIVICRSLLERIRTEHISPHFFSLFLPWSKCPDTIAFCIRSGPSCTVRNQGIKQFGRAMINVEEWGPAWEAMGGTKGIAELCAQLSVVDVKALLRVIGRCNIGQRRIEAREEVIEELLYALVPSHYRERPGSKLQNSDDRPLEDYCAQIVPACSEEFVQQLLDDKDHSNPLYEQLPVARLIKSHGKLLRKRAIGSIFGDGDEEDHLDIYLNAFVYREPSMPSPDRKISASMAFALKLLQLRLEDIKNDKTWPSNVSEADIYFSLLHRSLRRKLPKNKIHSIYLLGLRLVEAKPKLKPTFRSNGIFSQLIDRWVRDPTLYEKILGFALRLELGGSQKTVGQNYLLSSRALGKKIHLRWPLLRLYCLHIPKIGIDIDNFDNMRPLAKQPWSTEVFERLSTAQAVRLLKGLIAANPEYDFLLSSSRDSIISSKNITSQRNFNASLYLTILQRTSDESQSKTKSAVDELRKKAATAKEQSDRAQFAKAASYYAIASGDLDLYSETVTWQQRFVRDPLTSKVIFGGDVVETREGIDLLCGIPQPLPDGMSLAAVASRVGKANEIIMKFHEAMIIAKREPSFHQPDWTGVSSLFGSVISQRVTYARDLQKRLDSSTPDFYVAIWRETLDMLGKVSNDFLNQAYTPIKTLLSTLPPTVLAAITKAMLEAGTERRKKQDRQPGDDTLERLSYDILLQLSKGDRPELAQQLVLRTILDRPEASSWHRQLLSIKFMKRLPAQEAHKMLLAFATSIGEKLEEQSYVQVGVAQPPQAAPPQSLVKVTTVKYLAQLLDNAEFVSAEAAVEVLVELFKAGTHRDIRLATMDSLLSLLSKLCIGPETTWKSDLLVEKIMEALENVVPVVGSINERRPPRYEDWKEARETSVLPDISDITAGLPPLMSVLFTASNKRSRYVGLKHLRAEFMARYLLPSLELSQAEHRKWIELFLAKHKSNLKPDDLPSAPVSPEVWGILVGQYSELLPRTVLNDYNQYIVMTIAPPPALERFNQSLKTDVDMRNTPEVQHWLSVFDQSTKRYLSSGTQTLVNMVYYDEPKSLVHNGISFGEVQGMIIQHAALLLDQYQTRTEFWNDFVADLRPPSKLKYEASNADGLRSLVPTWQKSGRLVLEKVTALVLEKRSKQEQEGVRSILPWVTKLQLWLLPYLCFPDASELMSQCRKFAKELERLLESFLKGDTHVLRWPRIAKDSYTISELLNTDEQRLLVAYYVGDLNDSQKTIDQTSAALNLVRVVLAMKLIADGKAGLKEHGRGKLLEERQSLLQNIKSRVEEWQDYPDEEIREKVVDWSKENRDLWNTLTRED